MKRKYLFAAAVALLCLPLAAQNERIYEYDEYGKVGRSEGWARRFAHNFVDGLIGADYYESSSKEAETAKTDETGNTNKNVKKSYRHFGPGHTPDLYFGVNMLCTDLPPVMTPGLEQRAGKGFEFGLAIGQWGYHMTKNIAVNTAFYISRSRYWLADGNYIDWERSDPNEKSHIAINRTGLYDNRDVDQGYLRYWSLRVPLCLEISSASHRGPFLAVGPELEYRFGDMSKVRLVGGDKQKVTKNLNLQPLGINAVARIGINNFGILARYSFTSLFTNDNPVQTYPFMIGLSASF